MITEKAPAPERQALALVKHMEGVQSYRQALQTLQSTWDSLTLLGQLSGVGTSMASTREAFERLTGDLLNHLGREVSRKTVRELAAKAQVAIDILVRNLFERTADIGFLATDEDLREFARMAPVDREPRRESIRERLRAYCAKYSVYADVVLLDTEGQVLARLDDSVSMERSRDPIVADALATGQPYVESYRQHDLLPGGETLCYAYRVTCGEQALGVLVLCFRLDNEMERIFGGLARGQDWTVMTLLDAQGHVLASSDPVQVPRGLRLAGAGAVGGVVRHGGREYLAVACEAQGYQGYLGPGWRAQAMLPLEHAFDESAASTLSGQDPRTLASVMRSPSLFDAALRDIPLQAERIQADLNRSVWNGSLRAAATQTHDGGTFSKVLLREISRTGARMQDVFAQSIANLHETVVRSVLGDGQLLASLAIDIMDRNLYERANDARWWALTSSLRARLARGNGPAQDELGATLAYINDLYTVYANIVVFDERGRVVAVSRPQALPGIVGETLGEEWVAKVLALRDEQSYAVSAFQSTPLYGGKRTYVYGAAIHAPASGGGETRPVGGIALVFDAAPQFAAILRDALPRGAGGQPVPGAFAAFVDQGGQVIACSDDRWVPGECLPMASAFLAMGSGDSRSALLPQNGKVCAVGAAMSQGYREYKGPQDRYRNDVLALVFQPLCDVDAGQPVPATPALVLRPDGAERGARFDAATLRVGETWFALRASSIVEALPPVRLAERPGVGSTFLGYVMHQGAPIAVHDVATLLCAPGWHTVGRQVVVLSRPGLRSRFGIVVDGLGDIAEIALDRLQASPAHARGTQPLAEAIVKLDAGHSLLFLLDVDRLAVGLGATAPAVASTAAAPAATMAPAPQPGALASLRRTG